jgi:hypothetical protein
MMAKIHSSKKKKNKNSFVQWFEVKLVCGRQLHGICATFKNLCLGFKSLPLLKTKHEHVEYQSPLIRPQWVGVNVMP